MIGESKIFTLLLFSIVLLVGMDFLISGVSFLIFRDYKHMPKLYAYQIYQVCESGLEKYQGDCKFARAMFGKAALTFYNILGGLMLVYPSLSLLIHMITGM
jgi:hypothetical protein